MTEKQKERVLILTTRLKSETSIQSKEYLRTDKGFSALGLACELSNLGTWVKKTNTIQSYKVENSIESFFLPEEVQKYYGCESKRGFTFSILANDKKYSIYELSEAGYTFKEIANFIEKFVLNKAEK